jgi:serine protease AprX
VVSTSTENTFTTWASSIGTVLANQYIDSANMVDATGLGPDGLYGYKVGNGKGTFAGFDAEVTPGNAITKVEAVFYAYVNASYLKDYRIKTYLNGKEMGKVSVKTSIFSNVVGAQNAGLVYVDITSTNNWQWIDFSSDLELYIEQAGFASGNTVYYDAIGLHVTSAPGTDTSLDAQLSFAEYDEWVSPDQQVNVYNDVIGASQLWNTNSKLQGKNVGVAVVDSGIAKIKDLKVKYRVNFNDSYHDSADRYGHGTFVAGILAGNGKSSGGKYIGVAPATLLYNVRVSDDSGMTYVSDVIESLEWIYKYKDKYKIRVVNLSLNQSVSESYHTSPLDAAVEILWFNGVVVVVSAGNNGTATLYPPANDPFVITVGATDDRGTLSKSDDTVTTFSAYGITEDGFAKPDLVAPGHNIIGLLPKNDKLSMGKGHPKNQIDSTYFKMSGTSVSAPMVSGAIALLLQDEPELNPDQVKARLMATANKNWPGYNPTTAGAGYLDINAAVYANTTDIANQGVLPSQLLYTGDNPIAWNSVGWNSVGWNSVGWNSVGWNSVGWNSVGWNSDHWDD